MAIQGDANTEKAQTWKLIDRILGETKRAVGNRPDWRIHAESNTSVVLTFSKQGQLFYDIAKKDLEQFASCKRAFYVFLAGSHKEVFVVPVKDLQREIEAHDLKPSEEYQDFKLHLTRDHRGAFFEKFRI